MRLLIFLHNLSTSELCTIIRGFDKTLSALSSPGKVVSAHGESSPPARGRAALTSLAKSIPAAGKAFSLFTVSPAPVVVDSVTDGEAAPGKVFSLFTVSPAPVIVHPDTDDYSLVLS